MTRQRSSLLFVLVAALALVASACSSGSTTTRSAAAAGGIDTTGFSAPMGDPAKPIDADEWCLRPQSSNGKSGFAWVRNIVSCQVMTNTTKIFTAPGVLGGVLPLGVTKADCSYNDKTCKDVGGDRYGQVRDEGVDASNVTLKGTRYANPNPFLVKSAIQFMPAKIWQGTDIVTYVGANKAPFALSQSQARMSTNIPTTGTNKAGCTSGAFIACDLVTPQSDYENGSQLQFDFRFSTRPASIQIVNGTTYVMTIQGSQTGTAGSAFLIDPVATTGLASIAAGGGSAYTGGYLGTSSDPSRYWRASYCITVEGACYQINISISMTVKDGKLQSNSSCDIASAGRVIAPRCEIPQPTGGDDGWFFTVNVKT